MADHDESLIDKVKNALGMGDRDDDDRRETDRSTTEREPGAGDDLDADRADGWAGVPHAAGVGSSDRSTDATGRSDVDYGSGTPEAGIGLDREATSGTGDHNTGTGLDYDFEERAVTSDAPGGAAGTDEDATWTRREQGSAEGPLVQGENRDVEEERRESGM
jgi:hypothetical protein